ncbi:unnamed protein product [Scytosiphon promiscuus]
MSNTSFSRILPPSALFEALRRLSGFSFSQSRCSLPPSCPLSPLLSPSVLPFVLSAVAQVLIRHARKLVRKVLPATLIGCGPVLWPCVLARGSTILICSSLKGSSCESLASV